MNIDEDVLKMLYRELEQNVITLKSLKLRGHNAVEVRKVIANLEAQNQVLCMHLKKTSKKS